MKVVLPPQMFQAVCGFWAIVDRYSGYAVLARMKRNLIMRSDIDAKFEMILSKLEKLKIFENRLDGMESARVSIDQRIDSKIDKIIDEKFEERMAEKEEKEKRKENIIIWNLRESRVTEKAERAEDEIKEVKKLLDHIAPGCSDKLSDPVRLGAEGRKTSQTQSWV